MKKMTRRNAAYAMSLGLVPLVGKVVPGELRKRVVPMDVVQRFNLRPSEGYGLFVLGEDGKPYDLDDVLRVLFDLTRGHWQLPAKK